MADYIGLAYVLDAGVQATHENWKVADSALRDIRTTVTTLEGLGQGATDQQISDLDTALHDFQLLFNVLEPGA